MINMGVLALNTLGSTVGTFSTGEGGGVPTVSRVGNYKN